MSLVVCAVPGQDLEHHGIWLRWAWRWVEANDIGCFHGVVVASARQLLVFTSQAVYGSTYIGGRAIFDKVNAGLEAQLLLNGGPLLLQSRCIHLPLEHINIQSIVCRQLLGCQRKDIRLWIAYEDHLLRRRKRLGKLASGLQRQTLIVLRWRTVAEIFRGERATYGICITGWQVGVVQCECLAGAEEYQKALLRGRGRSGIR